MSRKPIVSEHSAIGRALHDRKHPYPSEIHGRRLDGWWRLWISEGGRVGGGGGIPCEGAVACFHRPAGAPIGGGGGTLWSHAQNAWHRGRQPAGAPPRRAAFFGRRVDKSLLLADRRLKNAWPRALPAAGGLNRGQSRARRRRRARRRVVPSTTGSARSGRGPRP